MPLLVEKVLLLRRSPYFETVGEAALARIADQMEEIDVGAGTAIFGPGDYFDGLYAVASGSVSIAREGFQSQALGPGSVLGLAHLFNDRALRFTVTADAPTLLLHLSQDDLVDLMAEHVDLSRNLVRGLARMASA